MARKPFPPCYDRKRPTHTRSRCPECGLVVCIVCAEKPYACCCDEPKAREVRYPRLSWSRGEAWAHLHAQMIPGCPKIQLRDGTWVHGWRKCHGMGYWAWRYEGLPEP